LLASRAAGIGAMPERLGLTSKQFGAMLALHFPGIDGHELKAGPSLPLDRTAEREELRTLFLVHAADLNPERVWMADLLVAGCMGDDHLWQDLGLWSRPDVSGLIAHNFPALKAKNDRDMKWKKFLYKQLCVQEGVYTCRSPSCEVCGDYKSCFALEE
jgi:nitrogen fixation protein NifQ